MVSSFQPLRNYSRVVFEIFTDKSVYTPIPSFCYLNFTNGQPDLLLSPNHLEDETFSIIRTSGEGNIPSQFQVFIQANCVNPTFLTNRMRATGEYNSPINFAPHAREDEIWRLDKLSPGVLSSGSVVNIASVAVPGKTHVISKFNEKPVLEDVLSSTLAMEPCVWNKDDLLATPWLARCFHCHQDENGNPLINTSGQPVRVIFQLSNKYDEPKYIDLHPGEEVRILGEPDFASKSIGYVMLLDGARTGNYLRGEHLVRADNDGVKLRIHPDGQILARTPLLG